MAEQLAPVAPPKHVWRRIQSQLGLTDEVTEVVPLKPNPGSKIWPMLASAALLLLAVLAVRYDPEVPQPQYQQIAIFNNAEAEPVWLLEISETEIIVRATASLQQRAENDYQLWIVVQDGRAPISLGLLPQGGRISLDKLPIYDQISIAALAVSLEPLGGSPNGLPTEVLYTTQPVTL
ncbi:anti-sigma factor [Planctobacterium marinum]|uniref:anti-sigma factor n=1 Tax=Planctobacterium marinum TaxID=1631968 RepID=UPI001E3DB832|nr:anti-sigma factor [Planctobacterium marinum]MCC2606703.1 anti-sigma factor [Planctobacterium marinum]